MIAGVCGGLGDYFDVDSNIVRIIMILLIFPGGLGILFYIVLLVLIPESPYDPWAEPGRKKNIH